MRKPCAARMRYRAWYAAGMELAAEDEAPIACAAAGSRCETVLTDIWQQHVHAVSCRSGPYFNRAALTCATRSDVFRSRAGARAFGIKICVIH